MRLVLRRDPSAATAGQMGRTTEFRLLETAVRGGVPVPTVRFLLDDVDGLGCGFVMDRVEGETIPRKILRDEAYAPARPRLARQCGEIAARLHALDPSSLPELPVLGATEQIDEYRRTLDSLGEPHPAFELGLRWLADAVPAPARAAAAAPRLVHGDFRTGNLVVGPEGLRAVLDWELAHLGDPVEDLGWLCVKSWRFGVVGKPVGGFGAYDDLLGAYEAAGGAPVEPDHLRYWEVFGTLKWGVMCEMQCFAHLTGLVRSVELAALGRRVAEMEWDLLEMIG